MGFALCWSQINTVSRWNESDLDHVLTEGDLLYALLIYYMLTADDLTRSIVMCNIEFPVDFLELKTEIAHLRNRENYIHVFLSSVSQHGAVLFSVAVDSFQYL